MIPQVGVEFKGMPGLQVWHVGRAWSLGIVWIAGEDEADERLRVWRLARNLVVRATLDQSWAGRQRGVGAARTKSLWLRRHSP
jgi:hypothetical protein